MLWRKAVFYSINLLIYDSNTSPINSIRPKGCGRIQGHLEVQGVLTDVTM